MNGKPIVILIALKPYKVFIGPSTWSWYIPTITSNLLVFSLKKIVSGEYGPSTLILILFKYFIAGIISFFSLLSLSKLSQCGFSPVTAIFGLVLSIFL